MGENSEVIEQRNGLERQLSEQNKMLQNFQYAITAELGQDLADTSFSDDEDSSPVERIQMAISAYFTHQQTLRTELQVMTSASMARLRTILAGRFRHVNQLTLY